MLLRVMFRVNTTWLHCFFRFAAPLVGVFPRSRKHPHARYVCVFPAFIEVRLASVSRESLCTSRAPCAFVLQDMECKESSFLLVNACVLLMEHFPCTECRASYGLEQPCYVELGAPEENVRQRNNKLSRM